MSWVHDAEPNAIKARAVGVVTSCLPARDAVLPHKLHFRLTQILQYVRTMAFCMWLIHILLVLCLAQ